MKRPKAKFRVGQVVRIRQPIFQGYFGTITKATHVHANAPYIQSGWSYWVILDRDPPDYLNFKDIPRAKRRRIYLAEGTLEPLGLLEELAFAAR